MTCCVSYISCQLVSLFWITSADLFRVAFCVWARPHWLNLLGKPSYHRFFFYAVHLSAVCKRVKDTSLTVTHLAQSKSDNDAWQVGWITLHRHHFGAGSKMSQWWLNVGNFEAVTVCLKHMTHQSYFDFNAQLLH